MIETKLNGTTPDIAEENIAKLKEIFPDVFCEGKVDFEKLQQVLGNYVEDAKERYNFSWNGKGKSLKLAQSPSTGTLLPCKEESKDWDTTENLYIEGDNLEVLKLLQKSYHNKIKMIYIDPPYNTGHDFVYKDNFKDNLQNYLEITGQTDEDGNKLTTNSESNGRYHTDWLNMMYPRLRLARNLLADDGVIFISIDDNEITNLKKICDEIFGEDLCIGTVIQNKQNSKNDTINMQKNHEYIAVYQKTIQYDSNSNKVKSVMNDIIENKKDVYKENGKYFYINDSITTRGEGGTLSSRPNLGYTVYYHPITKDKIAVCDYDISKAQDAQDYTIYEDDVNLISKGYVAIRPPKVRGKLGVWTWSLDKFNSEKDNIVITGKAESYAVKKRTFISESEVQYNNGKMEYISKNISNVRSIWDFSTNDGTTALNEVMDIQNVFNNAKNLEMIIKMMKILNDKKSIILDFFSGSATTAHAVMKLNAEDGGNRKFICVQLPETCDESSEAFKAGYKNICEIGKERIRRAGEKIKSEIEAVNVQIALDEDEKKVPDIGFKVFKLNSSNIKKWQPDFDEIEDYISFMENNFIDNRTQLDVVYEIMIKYGLDLTYPVEELSCGETTLYSIGMGMLIICLENNIGADVAKFISDYKKENEIDGMRVVFADGCFGGNDSLKTNIKEILKVAGVEEFITI